MSKQRFYHLSYDVQDSSAPGGKTILDRLVKYIENSLSGVLVIRPVASTIVFATDVGYSSVLTGVRDNFGREIYYVLSMSAKVSDKDEHFIWLHENVELTKNFKDKHFSV